MIVGLYPLVDCWFLFQLIVGLYLQLIVCVYHQLIVGLYPS